jgi:hypothetical protein
MRVLPTAIDERFLAHRRQSTSIAGVVVGVVATCLFGYRYYFDHVWSWDLLAISFTFVTVKVALMTWYYLTD